MPPLRCRTVRQSSSGSFANTSPGSAGATIQAGSSSSASSCPGPQPEAVVVLIEVDEPLDHAEPIVGGVAYMPPDADPEELGATRARVFAGYSGWGPGQLETELEEPAWIVAPAEPEDVFASDPDELWRTVLQRKGGMFSLLATMPYDPELN